MARKLNVTKRTDALRSILERTSQNAVRATEIAEELTNHFSGDKTPEGKQARDIAKQAQKLASAVSRATASVEF